MSAIYFGVLIPRCCQPGGGAYLKCRLRHHAGEWLSIAALMSDFSIACSCRAITLIIAGENYVGAARHTRDCLPKMTLWRLGRVPMYSKRLAARRPYADARVYASRHAPVREGVGFDRHTKLSGSAGDHRNCHAKRHASEARERDARYGSAVAGIQTGAPDTAFTTHWRAAATYRLP